ncbi:ATP-binding cassette subfamily B protein/ATP-binding cassette subfamily C protein [Keratinibaculum paraultunense]|uniref:ATP-binding cassette subfamily B protein/ATP-binding cassette subfamily C protein n=1 Tax=Keratinibaculum paraultunense TaxID=1278232 RepID=A0A4R3KSL3_9FIRM|nr:ABC transporter ATP-binding protein [Keratinibaculum paraultunense]QQY79544.1 ABC transporter ATP-binding protein [Keratinibaculum paraultunense]TCS87569.1 ATP-binding cassette subfamily B protein/ATP-binding cassette subfamily C protein [Keratinibaculum paraultunense]
MEKQIKYPFCKTINRLIKNVNEKNPKLYIYFFIYTIAAIIYPFFSILLPKLLIEQFSLGSMISLKNILRIILSFFILSSIVGFIETYIKSSCYTKITALRLDYLKDQFQKLVEMDYKYVEDASFYETYDRALEANNSNDNGVEGVYHKLFTTPAVFITSILFSIWIGRVSIWILLSLILNVVANLWIQRKVNEYEYSMKKELSRQNRRKRYYYETTHDFSFGKEIRLYNLKNRVLENYNKEIQKYIDLNKLIKKKEFALGFLGLFTLFINQAALYGILIWKVVHGMSIADFSMYLALILQLSLLLNTLIEDISFIYRESLYVHDFFKFLDTDLGEIGGEKKAIEKDTLEIEFKNVSFKYPKTDNYIFENLNFKIPKGQRLAIVGLNGAGKSTLVKLMTGLYDVDEGEILINGIPIKDFNKKELYSMFSVVFQDVNILAYTLAENVACASENIDKDRVYEVLDKVGLKNKVASFPKGLDQMMLKIIDENGTELSGGESQKLAIARALYKDGNMVIMDEPTSALDALAEAEIYKDFSELVENKTSIYISHRLSSTKFCDAIALFDKRGLIEYGTHEELMEKRGEYYKMFTIQGKYYQEGGEIIETA